MIYEKVNNFIIEVKTLDREKIKEKLLLEKNANLIDVLQIASSLYAKVLVSDENYKISYNYFKISEDTIQDLTENEKEEIKHFFEINSEDVVY